jgi:arylsulfatase
VTLVVRALRKQAAHSNLIICVIDAARADHLSGYGYPRATTPILDALAQDSVVFRSHFTQYPSTKPSTASLFSGQQADTHLAYQQQPLSPETFTLAEGLARAGFRTALFSSNPNASPSMGIGLDFQETFDQNDVAPLVGHWQKFTLPDPLLTLFKKWVKLHRGERFFAYVHFDPPHQPYLQPEEMTALFAGQKPPGFSPGPYQFPVGDRETLKKSSHPALPEWINLYDANLRYADWAVGELVQTLREQRLLENTVLLVTSDHGEAFGEHGYIWHERGVYDELLRIPLLLRLPAGAPQREVTELTQTIDILPTVFDLFRVSYPAGQAQGKSLLPLLAGQESPLHEYIISRSDGNPPSYLVRSKDWAYMLWGNGTWRALYDLQRDPAQRKNVAGDHPQVANEMLKHFRSFAETQRRKPLEFLSPSAVPAPTTPSTNTHKLSAEERKRLETLGYLK